MTYTGSTATCVNFTVFFLLPTPWDHLMHRLFGRPYRVRACATI
jgi:hypothetical protein